MTITVNGQERRLDDGATVQSLLDELGLPPDATVVERNGEVVPRAAFALTALADADVLELVRFVGGG